ncbi:cytochrome P450 [Dictyobacter arantiisoli]|uniref:Cytochrome P450 n=2 Tax=Dictyobacter arantiisoli TaxID=2014874 RepID=A0A5A5TH32_9CHLR|nr:cytochrome P450 [Dictyobacter arantiisoli]
MAVSQNNLLDQVLAYANRPNPYPLFAQLREHPVLAQGDGRYVVSTYKEINDILHDPRFSSDMSKCYSKEDQRVVEEEGQIPGFVFLDPPKHDWLRHQVMSKFTPDLIYSQKPRLLEVVKEALDTRRNVQQLDIVDDVAYPVPVTIICEILGVPRSDEYLFHEWSDQLILGNDTSQARNPEIRMQTLKAIKSIRTYMADLINAIKRQPREGLLSAMLHDTTNEKLMSNDELVTTSVLLLVAGHETTVNLISNSMFTLLRFPEWLERLRKEPELAAQVVEEVLRYEPPVQMLRRTSLADVTIAGVTIPKGAPIHLIIAAANRDPEHFSEPDRFNPERKDIDHLGFGGGIHYCVGAPLARLETQVTLVELARRLENPQLIDAAPPYRLGASIRAPRHLFVHYDHMRD